jgi:hypothetical protein
VLQRLIAAVLGVLGLLAIGLGVASSTVWRGDDILVATASPDAHLVVADPGVLELAGNPVTVTVHAANDTPVVIAVGRDTDVAGWVGMDAHAQVTGLAGWHALRTEPVAEQAPTPAASAAVEPAAPEPAASEPAASEPAASDPSASATGESAGGATAAVADPSGSDLWVMQATGNGTATLTWDAQPGRWSLLVASLGEPSPVIELAWPRTVTTPWLWPGVVGGALLLLTGLGLGARLWLRARRGLTEPEWHPVLTGAVPTVTVAGSGAGTSAVSVDATQTVVFTRRQMREAKAANGAATRRRGRGASEDSLTGAQPLLLPGAGPEAPTEAPAPAGDVPPVAPVSAPATGPAPANRPAPADVQPAARREAGRGATGPRVEREPNLAAGPTSAPSVDDSRPQPGPKSGAPVPPHAAPPHTPAGQPSSTAALPSYFLRPNAPGGARTAPGGPVAAGGWVPDGMQPESPSPRPGADPGTARPSSAHRAAQPDTAVGGGPDRTFAPRPTWAAGKPVIPDEPTDEPSDEPPSARADAWRRAWGFPGHDAGGADDAAGATDEGTHR